MSITGDTYDDSRAPKRHRGELDTELLVNHPTRYHEDGNLIFQCGQTLFCVHHTVVVKVSTVFQEMLASDRINETIRGCTLLKLDDNESDMASFLSALYGERYVGLPMTSSLNSYIVMPTHLPHSIIIGLHRITRENFSPLSSILRLAHKYHVAHLKTDFLAPLHAAWPSNLPHHL